MPIDVNLLREAKGGDLAAVRTSQAARFANPATVDRVVELDEKWREAKAEAETLQMEFNKVVKEIGTLRKAKQDTTALQEQTKTMKAAIAAASSAAADSEAARDAALGAIGNIVHPSVPVSADEANNAVVRTWGDAGPPPGAGHNHVTLVNLLDIADTEAGAAVAGSRGYFLKGEGVLLNQALIQAALAAGVAAGATPIQTPYFMVKDAMAAVAQLSQFDEELYVVGPGAQKGGNEGAGAGDAPPAADKGEEDKYLIATSEQPLCAMHRGKWFEERDLPLRYIGYSTCFRKEAGSHGRDTLGIFRVHQFEKVEQFVVTTSRGDASWEALDTMLATAESFYQSLGLPYRVVNIVSGELNNAAAKKYDLEAWFPAGQAYRELVSASNCTDYQARAVEARLRAPPAAPGEAPKKEYVHMLNSTLAATERALCCVLENYQTADGVRIPEALARHMPGGIDFIPFRKKVDAKGKYLPLDA